MDIVYPYKSTSGDFELRYSLRSLEHMRHAAVIVAGDRPAIASDALAVVTVPPIVDRFASSTANILAAAERSDADEICVMHDDIFLLKPWTFQHENRGTIAEYLATWQAAGMYRARIEWTRDILRAHGIEEPLWYGLHTPTVYKRSAVVDVIREFGAAKFLLRTLYHNLFPQPSVRRDDVKLRRWSGDFSGDVLSIADAVPGSAGFRRWIAARFPHRCKYEIEIKSKGAAA